MTERERLRHEMLALTAEGRMSAWVLGIFPPAFAVILYMIQPDYMSTLFQNTIGIMAVVRLGDHGRPRVPVAPQDHGDRGVTQ